MKRRSHWVHLCESSNCFLSAIQAKAHDLSLLLIEYVAATGAGHNVDNAIARKDKSSLPMPVSFGLYSQITD